MGLFRYLKARLEPIVLRDKAFVDKAFRDILGREADHGGLEYYRGLLRDGHSRTAILLDIMRSEEFRRHLPPISTSLPNLILQHPERYRRTVDRTNGNSIL